MDTKAQNGRNLVDVINDKVNEFYPLVEHSVSNRSLSVSLEGLFSSLLGTIRPTPKTDNEKNVETMKFSKELIARYLQESFSLIDPNCVNFLACVDAIYSLYDKYFEKLKQEIDEQNKWVQFWSNKNNEKQQEIEKLKHRHASKENDLMFENARLKKICDGITMERVIMAINNKIQSTIKEDWPNQQEEIKELAEAIVAELKKEGV